MGHGESKVGISDARAFATASLDDEQATIDLLPPIHARGVFLADEAPLGEADPIEIRRVAFEPEQVAKLGAAFTDPEAEAVLEPADCRLGLRREPALAERREPRIGVAAEFLRPMHREGRVALDQDRPAQAVDRQALHKIVGGGGFAVEQQIVARVLVTWPDDEVEQALALRGQQARPDRQRAGDIACDEPLKEP